MIKLLIALLTLITITTPSPPITGWASYYEQQPTDATLAYRVDIGDISHADLLWANALIAVSDCSKIGDRVTIQLGDGPMMNAVVFDCAGNDGTPQWMADSNVILEVDFYTATRHGMIEGGAVRVKLWN